MEPVEAAHLWRAVIKYGLSSYSHRTNLRVPNSDNTTTHSHVFPQTPKRCSATTRFIPLPPSIHNLSSIVKWR